MPAEKKNSIDYRTLSSSANKGGKKTHEQTTLKPLNQEGIEQTTSPAPSDFVKPKQSRQIPSENSSVNTEDVQAEFGVLPALNQVNLNETSSDSTQTKQQKSKKEEKKAAKDRDLLGNDRWLERNGHTFTYVGLYLFSILVLFRPYELIPGLGFLSATAFYFAIATLLIFIPTQFSTEGNFTILTTEVKAVLVLIAISLLTIPIAKDPGMAWKEFNDTFIKAVLIFVIMVNVIRTQARLMGMMWLSLSIGVVLSYLAIGMYSRGEMNVEGYRVSVQIGGMFQNPNEMSLHLIMMIPLAITLGLATKSALMKLVYLATTIFLLSANMITFSRGGFLGLLGASALMVWKLGRRNRVSVTLFSVVIGTVITLLAPGNYGLRVLSIFIPGLDPVGSSSQRSELLERSILVSLRNPWGIGMGNFPIVGIRNLVSHNAFTQVSAELGVLGLIAYLVFMLSPFRKLGAIERTQFEKNETDWFFYTAIGLQASIVAYLIGSFFASVAYNWFIYYLIAYAVAFRRVYQIEKGLNEEVKAQPLIESFWSAKPA